MNKHTVVIVDGNNIEQKGFHYKSDAIAHALAAVKKDHAAHIRNERTGYITYILHPARCSCSRCGNELEGKLHCPLCGAYHYYG